MRRAVLGLASCLLAGAAQAQNIPNPLPINRGFNFDANTYYFEALTITRRPDGGINTDISGYVSAREFLAAAQNSPVNSAALTAIASRIDRLNDRLSEGIALAGSFNVMPPNLGDRFAVSVGGAGYNGAGAASITASARIDESTIVYGGIARGPSQTMVKGGLGWSFR